MKTPLGALLAVVWTMLLTFIVAFAAPPGNDKDKKDAPPFHPGRAVTFVAKSTQAKVTVGVKAYEREEDLRAAFGKTPLERYGVLPVLVVIDNDGPKAIALRLRVEFIDGKNDKIQPTPPTEVQYLKPAKAPSMMDPSRQSPIPLPKKKNPLASWEVDGRAFSAKMVPAGDSVSGFFYFQTEIWKGARIYIDGMTDTSTGEPLFYFEIPLEP
jgi:hypothetical protein